MPAFVKRASETDAPTSGSRFLLPFQRQRLVTQFGPLSTGRATLEITQKMQRNEPPCPETIFRFGVLQLRMYRFETMHFEVIASKVGYLNKPQDRVCVLFILQAKAVRIAILQSGLQGS
jgi:hypothetical protein